MTIDNNRRRLLARAGLMAAFIPIVALAAKNDGMRASMKYRDTPEGDKKCSGCQLFVPGKTATDLGGCKLFPGDTEISPQGYCVAWANKS
jgi:hypothetical protein